MFYKKNKTAATNGDIHYIVLEIRKKEYLKESLLLFPKEPENRHGCRYTLFEMRKCFVKFLRLRRASAFVSPPVIIVNSEK